MQMITMVSEWNINNLSHYLDTEIRNAAENGQLEVVKLLLQDSRVDPSKGIWMKYK